MAEVPVFVEALANFLPEADPPGAEFPYVWPVRPRGVQKTPIGRWQVAALTAVLLVVGTGSGPCDSVDGSLEPLSEAAERAARTQAPFRLASVTDFDWDQVHAFPPYTSPDEIERELGFDCSDLLVARRRQRTCE